MGKARKGKRTDKDDEVDSDVEVEEQANGESSKSKAKDKKKKRGNDVDEITEEMKDLKVDKKLPKKDKKSRKGADDSDEEMVPIAKSKGRKGSSVQNIDEGDSESEAETSKAKQKNRKKGKKNQEDTDDEEEGKNVKEKKNKKGKKGQEDTDDEEEEQKSKGKKNKKGKKGHEDSDDEEEEEQKQKGKKNKKGKKQVESEDSDFDTKKPKGKSKKGRKNLDSDDSEDEEESVKGKNKGKKGKKADSDEDVEDKKVKGKGKNKERKVSESEEEFSTEKVKPVKGNKAARGGFALLDVEGDDVDEDEPPIESENESEKMTSIDRSKYSKPQPVQDQKKSKKGKKKRNDDDEDIDKVLAELELEYAGQKKVTEDPKPEEDDKKKGKGKEKDKDKKIEKDEIKDEDDQEGSTVKSAAQKKKEKKEREKQKKLAQKKAEAAKKADEPQTVEKSEVKKDKVVEKSAETIQDEGAEGEEVESGTKKKKGAKEDLKDKGKGPSKKAILAMQEALKKAKEEEERLMREEEERIRLEEEREEARLLALKLEQEKKEKKKLKEKQRKERLKAEGKLLTPKQKILQLRAQTMLDDLREKGMLPGEGGEKKPRPGTRIKPGKMKSQMSTEEKDEKKVENTTEVQVEIVDKQTKVEEEKKEDVKDSWDAESSDEHEEDKSDESSKDGKQPSKEATPAKNSSEIESEIGSEADSNSEDESGDDSEVDDKLTDAQRKKEKAKLRIETRRKEAEKKKTLDDLRAAVVCVLGHVDTGKTKILDKLRRTNVQDGEAGGITQQIGATNVPIEAIHDSTRHVKGFAEKKLKIPGLLIIDTPGHESFSNLRNRGSSLCDIAILVVDIMHGLEPQTIESINLLKLRKTPFIVALNKIDRIYDWNSMNRKDIQDIIKAQSLNSQREFEKRSKDVIVQFAEQGLNAALFYENSDPKTYVSLVPTSAITGEGMGNLLAMIVDSCQGPLAKKLMYSEELQATVLEVKVLPGLGTTIDCILVNGMLKEGETMIVAGTDGPIVTQIRSLLMPQPMKELRVKSAYIEHRQVKAAQGVKIAAKDLEKAIAGLNLQVAKKPDEVEVLRDEIAQELTHVLGNIKLAERGVFVQASTLGALEALLDFLKTSKIPYAGIRIGPVVKKDVMKASIMLEHDSQYATILAFDVKIEKDAQELADSIGVKIFQADIIYHLFDKFTAYREELKQRKREEHKHIAVFPCKLKVMPQFVFKTRDPIVAGVMVEAGILRPGTPVCVPSKEFIDLGVVTSVEMNHKPVESARKGQEVCIKIEPVPGEAPKMFGRHFDEKDLIVSKISRQSIDACKDYFRDDLLKTDWALIVELKKLFKIL